MAQEMFGDVPLRRLREKAQALMSSLPSRAIVNPFSDGREKVYCTLRDGKCAAEPSRNLPIFFDTIETAKKYMSVFVGEWYGHRVQVAILGKEEWVRNFKKLEGVLVETEELAEIPLMY